MDHKQYISITEFCTCHDIDHTFVYSLKDYGLIEIRTIEEEPSISEEQVREIEKMMRLHYDLQINLEGIDAIVHLLHRVADLQDEVRLLQNKLRRYQE